MVASSAPNVSHHVWKAPRVSSTGLTYPAIRDLTILPIHKRMNRWHKTRSWLFLQDR